MTVVPPGLRSSGSTSPTRLQCWARSRSWQRSAQTACTSAWVRRRLSARQHGQVLGACDRLIRSIDDTFTAACVGGTAHASVVAASETWTCAEWRRSTDGASWWSNRPEARGRAGDRRRRLEGAPARSPDAGLRSRRGRSRAARPRAETGGRSTCRHRPHHAERNHQPGSATLPRRRLNRQSAETGAGARLGDGIGPPRRHGNGLASYPFDRPRCPRGRRRGTSTRSAVAGRRPREWRLH